MTPLELAARAVVAATSIVAAAIGVPSWLAAAAGLGVLASCCQLIATLVPLPDAWGRALAGVTATVVLLILTGLCFNALPAGLSPVTTAAGWAAIQGVLVAAVVMRGGHAWPAIAWRPLALGCAVAATGLTAAFVIAHAGVEREDRTPRLELSALRRGATAVEVRVRSVGVAGRFSLEAVADGRVTGPPRDLELAATSSQSVEVRLSTATRYWSVRLAPATPARLGPQRELVLWKGA